MSEQEHIQIVTSTSRGHIQGDNHMQPNDITFFQRFQNDILAGRKTITIRDASESHFKQAMCYAWGGSKMMAIFAQSK